MMITIGTKTKMLKHLSGCLHQCPTRSRTYYYYYYLWGSLATGNV